MSVVQPEIDLLLDTVDGDRFLLCAVASRRARDINDMMRGQRERAGDRASQELIEHATVADIRAFAGRKALSIAMEEVARGEVGYDEDSLIPTDR